MELRPPPEHLSEHDKAEWLVVMRFLDTIGLLANNDHDSLAAYVKVYAPLAWRLSRQTRPIDLGGRENMPRPSRQDGPGAAKMV